MYFITFVITCVYFSPNQEKKITSILRVQSCACQTSLFYVIIIPGPILRHLCELEKFGCFPEIKHVFDGGYYNNVFFHNQCFQNSFICILTIFELYRKFSLTRAYRKSF